MKIVFDEIKSLNLLNFSELAIIVQKSGVMLSRIKYEIMGMNETEGLRISQFNVREFSPALPLYERIQFSKLIQGTQFSKIVFIES